MKLPFQQTNPHFSNLFRILGAFSLFANSIQNSLESHFSCRLFPHFHLLPLLVACLLPRRWIFSSLRGLSSFHVFLVAVITKPLLQAFLVRSSNCRRGAGRCLYGETRNFIHGSLYLSVMQHSFDIMASLKTEMADNSYWKTQAFNQ